MLPYRALGTLAATVVVVVVAVRREKREIDEISKRCVDIQFLFIYLRCIIVFKAKKGF
jgi:hypothetical protein